MQFWIQNKFFKKPNLKKFYCYGKSKLKLSTAIPLLNDNNIHKAITSDFEVASLFNRRFQKVSKKDDYHQSFKLAQKKKL